MLRVKAAQGVSEPVRERETFKYDPTLLDDITFNDTSAPLDGSKLYTASDITLTALAQLGACRTRTARSLISLFDQRWQYIIAEASPTLPLLPNIGQDELKGEALWLSRTAIPRVLGVCNHTLVDPGSFDDPDTELPLTLVSDLTSDSRFCTKPYCLPGSPAQFYAAVPIRTPGGINIGVYCVIDTEPRPTSSWTDDQTEIIRNISRAIMSHLEYRSTKIKHKRGERMTRGIASFMEPDTGAPARHPQSRASITEFQKPQTSNAADTIPLDLKSGQEAAGTQSTPPLTPTLNTESSIASNQKHSPLGENSELPNGRNRPLLYRSRVSSASLSSTSEQSADEDRHTATERIFVKAANIVRESIETDGVLFVSANATNFGALSEPSQSCSNSSDEASANPDGDDTGIVCPILGASTSSLASNNINSERFRIPARFLSTLLRRYPMGKMFTYDEHGSLQTCDSSEDSDQSPPTPHAENKDSQQARKNSLSSYSKSSEGETLYKFFPGARCVVFVPMRDDLKERWFAGGFAYTLTPTRVLSASVELSYLRAFNTLVIAEIHRMEVTSAHKAKSDILNSLSHELRSPLHGVILSTELLADTSLDVFQGHILHTLETCGRTLLDTIDHMLDFSKINNYLKTVKAEKRATRGYRAHRNTSIEAGMKSLYSDISIDTLVEEVAESVFAGHYFQHMSIAQMGRRNEVDADSHANSHADFARAMEDLSPLPDEKGKLQFSVDHVSVHLDIDTNLSSLKFLSVAGAIRRIVMNLLGNALKYTEKGAIRVSVSLDPETTKSLRSNQRVVRLTVMDTGKGMSRDYIENDLYKPFCQEDQLSPGTGLGLSLVKKTVISLGGTVSIESQLHEGTIATVLLPLSVVPPPIMESPPEQHEHRESDNHKQELKGLRVHLAGFEARSRTVPNLPGLRRKGDIGVPIEKICREWLHMELITQAQSSQLAPDVILCTETGLEELSQSSTFSSNGPIVLVCDNALVAHDKSVSNNVPGKDRIYDFISQPVGPSKLARVLSHALRRWAEQQRFPPSPEHTPPSSNSGPNVLFEFESLQAPDTPQNPIKALIPTAIKETENPLGSLPSAYTTIDTSQRSNTGTRTSTKPVSLPEDLSPPQIEKLSIGGLPKAESALPSQNDVMEFLLVDDNPINLKILCVYMKKLGRSYATAIDGQDAVDKYKEYPGCFKYIFMDISMPRLDGMEATRQIRAFEREQHLERATVFALSGLASADVQQEAFGSGIDLFLTKPVKLKELSLILTSRGDLSLEK